jgi:hypothetical protein
MAACSTSPDVPGAEGATESGSDGESPATETSPTTDESSSSDTEASETTETETSAGADCTPLDYKVVQHNALTEDYCASGHEQQVFQSKAEVEAWLTAACDSPTSCLLNCDPPPNVPWNKTTLLLGSGSAPGGSESTFTWAIYDCGDHVEANYTFRAWGPELAFYQRQETVAIDKIDVPVEFYGETIYTPDPP